MKRFGTYAMNLAFVVSLWALPAPACAQDKFTMGYGNGT
jgi:hypothetical protein